MLCAACERGEHWDCGRQHWCECDCDPDNFYPEFDDLYYDPYETTETIGEEE